jgi:hypothetical protein
MAHYAFLDDQNIVTEVIAGKNEGEDGVDWEDWYGNFRGQVCKRTSYNTSGGVYYIPNSSLSDPDQTKAFRKNYAGLGYVYDAQRDAFIPPQPFASWALNEQSCLWEPPIPEPLGVVCYWDENTQSWVNQE